LTRRPSGLDFGRSEADSQHHSWGLRGGDLEGRKGRIMRKASILWVAAAALFVALMPGSGMAAGPVDRSHENFTDTFPDELCGIAGTSVVKGVDNFMLFGDNTYSDNFTVNQTFTATASGKSVVIHVGQRVTGLDDPIVNADGTLTFIDTFKGLPEQLRIKNGPLLSRDAGVVTLTRTGNFDPTGQFITDSLVVSGEKGPHPDLDSDFALFCDVLVPALT